MLTISSAEWEVMRVLWAKGQATSSEIIAILAKKLDWSASTVKTLLGRLADKGLSIKLAWVKMKRIFKL